MVEPGQKAPDFIAPGIVQGDGRMFELFTELESYEVVVLVFAPAAFVPTTTADFCAVRDAEWNEHPDIGVFGISGDSLFSHAAYVREYDLPFPLVTDFHSGIAESYDLCADEWEGHRQIPKRGVVVIDGDWEVRHIESVPEPLEQVSPAPVVRAGETLQTLGFDVAVPTVQYEY